MTISKKSKNFFVKNYGKSFFQSNDEFRFFLYTILLSLFIALFVKSKINEYRHIDLTKIGISKTKLKRLYIELAKRQEKERNQLSLKFWTSNQISIRLKTPEQHIQDEVRKSGLLDTSIVDTALLNQLKGKTKIEFELASEDELDNLLNNFVSAYKDEKAKEFELSVRSRNLLRSTPSTKIRESTFSRKRIKSLDFFNKLVTKSDRFYQGYRTRQEIKKINKTVQRQEYLFKTCIMKIKRAFPEKSFYFKLQFSVDSLGKVRKESVQITDTNIKIPSFKDCIIKRSKYFRGFLKAQKTRAADYIFRKKYIF